MEDGTPTSAPLRASRLTVVGDAADAHGSIHEHEFVARQQGLGVLPPQVVVGGGGVGGYAQERQPDRYLALAGRPGKQQDVGPLDLLVGVARPFRGTRLTAPRLARRSSRC